MGDFAGAVAAIEQRLRDNWATTPISVQNTPFDPPEQPGGGDFPELAPWVHLEVATSSAEMRGAGKPGDQLWGTMGTIFAYVMIPAGSGTDLGMQYATQIGEIFRGKVFYNRGDGCYVRCWAPRVDESRGVVGESDQGNWFGVTMSCPFEYWHQG